MGGSRKQGSAGAFAKALRNPSFRHGAEVGVKGTARAGVWKTRTMALAALSVLLAAGLGWALFAPEAPAPVTRYGIQFPQGQEPVDLVVESFALMRDGSGIVYVGPAEDGRQLWLKPRGEDQAAPLAGTQGAAGPSPSPDGGWIAFRVGTRLLKIPAVGGATITLADSVDSTPAASAWMDDGAIVYPGARLGLRRVAAEGGAAEVVYTPPDGQVAYAPTRVPGSRGLVFSQCEIPCAADAPHEIRALDLETGESRVVAPGGALARYVSSGDLVFVRPDGGVFALPFDPGKLEATGPAAPVLEGVKVDAGSFPDFDLTPDGTLLMRTGGGISAETEFVWVTRDGAVSAVKPGWTFDPGGANRGWALSPDDGRLAFRALVDGNYDIWVKELPDGPVSRLTFDPGEERMPRWTPDGVWVTFLSFRSSPLDMWRKRADGIGDAELVYDHDVALAQGFWGPDGREIVLRTAGAAGVEGGRDILIFRPGQDSAAVPLLAAEYDEWAPLVSQDGHWIAYQSTETGSNEIFVRPFPSVDDGKWQVSNGGGIMPLWAHSGRELFYVNGDGEIVSAEIQTEPRFRVGERKVLFKRPDGVITSGITGMWDITSDDQRFLMARPAGMTGAPPRMILVQNWLQELKERMGR